MPDGALLVVPTGSCEQHGPHLPLDTDTLIALALAAALAERRSDVVVAPAVTIGASGEHRSFPGTLSIGTRAMRDVAVEIVRSALPGASRSGDGGPLPHPFSAVLFLNAHGGNTEALRQAHTVAQAEGRPVGVWHPKVPGGDPHAGRTETSLMLHLHPHRVLMDLAEPGSAARFSEISEVLRTEGLAAVTPNGVLGDPTGATAAEGVQLFERLVEDLVTTADALLSPS